MGNSKERRKKMRTDREMGLLRENLRIAQVAVDEVDLLQKTIDTTRIELANAIARQRQWQVSNQELGEKLCAAEQREHDAREEHARAMGELRGAHARELAETRIKLDAAMAEDKDAKKLRRRLLERSNERDRLQQEIGKLVAEIDRLKS